MVVDKDVKNIVIVYTRTILAQNGTLTQDLYNRINAGEEAIVDGYANLRLFGELRT
jgi:hypothetical protein